MYCFRSMLPWNRASWYTWWTYTVAISSLCIGLCLLLFLFYFVDKIASRVTFMHTLQTRFVPQIHEKVLEARVILLYQHQYFDRFSEWRIGRGSAMVWAPRSPDLIACGFSFGGIVKQNLFQPRIRIEYWRRVASVTSKCQHGRCREERWEKLNFLRRKDVRIQTTSN
jgi:hypothetical protein